jgi:hypothetical protein
MKKRKNNKIDKIEKFLLNNNIWYKRFWIHKDCYLNLKFNHIIIFDSFIKDWKVIYKWFRNLFRIWCIHFGFYFVW